MIKKSVAVLLVLVVLSTVLLPGCNSDNVLYVYNWGDYIDKDVIKMFEEEYGIKVKYTTYTTNEDMYVKIKSGSANYDVIFPSEYMVNRMVDEGLLSEINLNNVPNFELIDGMFKNAEYDPNNKHSIPYMWGTVGILYNKTMVDDPVDSWDILWDEKYSKNILMVDSQRDSIGVALKRLGYSMNSLNEAEIDEARDKMINNEAALAVVWSGEAILAMQENEDLAYAIPKEGSNIWYDCMSIPASSQNKDYAEKFIDFMCRTDIALMNAEYTGYSTPHTEAKLQLDAELLENPAAYPSEEIIQDCEVFKFIGDFVEYYNEAWIEVTSS